MSSARYQGKKHILFNFIDVTKVKKLEYALIADEKMSSLGRVAAGIIHEIRNPLTGINMYLYNLQEICDTDVLEIEDKQLMTKMISHLKEASQKIESVIKRAMDFTKPAIPTMILSDINQIVREVVELSSVSLKKNGIMLKQVLTEDLPKCYADSQLISQMLLNLVNNAAAAMHNTEGIKTIEITTELNKNNVFIKVSDSGPGVPPEIRHKIFDPFFTTHRDGSGIGLNIVQRIATDHNGIIEVGTGKYGGAEFIFSMPIEQQQF